MARINGSEVCKKCLLAPLCPVRPLSEKPDDGQLEECREMHDLVYGYLTQVVMGKRLELPVDSRSWSAQVAIAGMVTAADSRDALPAELGPVREGVASTLDEYAVTIASLPKEGRFSR